MRIVLAGGGTGGHFYPLIAVAEAIHAIAAERNLIEPELMYIGPEPFDMVALQEHDIIYHRTSAGKVRNYVSHLNILDVFKASFGIIRATFHLYNIYPDVVFSTGGYAAFPTLAAARLLNIPVVIYDADAKPGRVSLWSSKFAKRIAVAHADAAKFFSEKVRHNIARTGHPIRKEIESPTKEGGYEFLKLSSDVPTIMVMGGSQGAQRINEILIDALPELLNKYNVVHQTGKGLFEDVDKVTKLVLRDHPHADRYRVFGLLNTLAIRMTAGIATLIVARAGSGTIFEIASWGKPAIIVPIPQEVSRDQTENAFSYARAGAAVVIEQRNLTPHILIAEVDRIISDSAKLSTMQEAAKLYARPHAARTIAQSLIDIGLEHEPV